MKSYKVAVPKGEVGEEEVLQVSEQKIKEDMQGRKIKFDLTREDRYWYKNPEKFWEEFRDTSEVKVPEKFEDWLIGQDRVKREARLQLEEWVRKLQDINEMRKKGVAVADVLRERPGPYLLLVGAPGTGKSLLTKILAADLERLYQKHGIKLYDMMLVKNRHNKFQPHNRIVPAGIGRRIVDVAIRERMTQGQRRGKWIFAGLMSMVIFGLVMMGTAFYNLALVMAQMGVVDGWTKAGAAVLQPWMAVGAIFTIFPLFLILGGRAFGINWKAPTEKELLDTPHLLVDNGSGRKLYVNSTISNSGKLFGDLEWCNTAETLVSDPRGRLYRICSPDYQDLLGSGKNPILMRHSFEQEIIAIRTRSGRVLRGNPSHPVMTRDGWKHLKDITEGTEVRVATELPMPVGNARLNWAKTISVYHGRNMAMHDDLCPEEAIEGLASLAGWLVAKGWVSYFNQDRPRALHAEVPPSEAAFIDHMSEEVQQIFGLKPAILKVSRGGAYGQACEMIRLTVNSVDVASWLAEDVAEKRVPDWVLASGEGVSSAFLRWLFEGDGCVSIASKGRFSVILSQRNPQLLRDVQTMLLRYGIQSSILKRKGREEYSLWIRRARDLRIFHERIGFVSEVKKAQLGRLVGLLPERTVAPSPWEAVVEVTRQGPEAVYGFMLGGDSTYWSNGILSHNSPFGEHPQLATPTHKRVVAGDVHHANMKILYIDELRNMDERMAVELLTVMEDGTAPIRGHQSMGGTHTASQNVETGPVDAMFFLIASANMDMIHDPHSILNLIPAFKDRFNYGNIVMMETEMEATPENEIKVAQVIADELYRFNLLPMEKAGVREIIDYMRRRASSNKKLSITFRSIIKLLKKSAQLGWVDNETMIRAHHVRAAIEEHAKPIEQQVMEQQVERQRPYKIIQKEGSKVGVVNGLVVLHDALSGEGTGDVATVAVWMQKVEDPQRADFVVTGINEDKNTWIADSKRHVRTAILKMYGVDISRDYYTHITFLQNKGVDGPSAGITMTLSIMSFLGDPSLPPEERVPIPLRQDVAVTGAVEIIAADGGVNRADVVVSPVGGIPDKVRGASRWGIKNVLIPLENWEHSLDESDRKNLGVTVVGCRTVQDYLTWIRADGKRPMEVDDDGN